MKVLNLLGVVLLLSFSAAGQDPNKASGLYFGQTAPADTPVVFAPGVISKEYRYEQFLTFSPDGTGLTFGVTTGDWSEFHLYHMTMEDGGWSEPVPAPFLGSDSTGLTSCISYDMNTAFFTDARPTWPPSDIWMSTRTTGGWSEPTEMGPPISSGSDEFEVAVSRN
jgi:hypothetical protein